LLKDYVKSPGAQTDTQLRSLCEAFLFKKSAKEKDDEELLDGDNPISTFSSRIKICKRLGLIDQALDDALNTLRSISNQSAHWISFPFSSLAYFAVHSAEHFIGRTRSAARRL
jgi:hypothetical protein